MHNYKCRVPSENPIQHLWITEIIQQTIFLWCTTKFIISLLTESCKYQSYMVMLTLTVLLYEHIWHSLTEQVMVVMLSLCPVSIKFSKPSFLIILEISTVSFRFSIWVCFLFPVCLKLTSCLICKMKISISYRSLPINQYKVLNRFSFFFLFLKGRKNFFLS